MRRTRGSFVKLLMRRHRHIDDATVAIEHDNDLGTTASELAADDADAIRATEQFSTDAQLPLEVAQLFLQRLPLRPQLFLERRGSDGPPISDDHAVELACRHPADYSLRAGDNESSLCAVTPAGTRLGASRHPIRSPQATEPATAPVKSARRRRR